MQYMHTAKFFFIKFPREYLQFQVSAGSVSLLAEVQIYVLNCDNWKGYELYSGASLLLYFCAFWQIVF